MGRGGGGWGGTKHTNYHQRKHTLLTTDINKVFIAAGFESTISSNVRYYAYNEDKGLNVLG